MRKYSALLLTLLLMWSCSNNNPSGPDPDDFNREAILINWSDNIIIPAFTAFSEKTQQLHNDAQNFSADPTQQNLESLRDAWRTAYIAFQQVSMFEMGAGMDYRNYLNTYPTYADSNSFKPEDDNISSIIENIESGNYNLTLPSTRTNQGFPALDYLLHGLGDTDAEILSRYTTNENAGNYRTYLTDLTERINDLTSQVLENWTTGYRDTFVSNSGNGANSSLDMMINDYIYYYEKHLRAGKIGIPAGAFSGSPLSSHVEAYYSSDFSKTLYEEALSASINFFNGTHFEAEVDGQSLDDYLDYLNTMKNGADLTSIINDQFQTTKDVSQNLNADFSAQVESDNSLMLATYDALQKNVVNLKVDMLQALNVNVDYVDADGD